MHVRDVMLIPVLCDFESYHSDRDISIHNRLGLSRNFVSGLLRSDRLVDRGSSLYVLGSSGLFHSHLVKNILINSGSNWYY